MESIEVVKKAVSERRPTPQHVFFAIFLASAAESGILTQGGVSLLARSAAPRLRDYMIAMGRELTGGAKGVEGVKRLVENLNETLMIADRVLVENSGDEVTVMIETGTCRYCPKGVGLAEVPGTLCPFPHLIRELARLEGIDAELVVERNRHRVEVLRKEGGWCRIRLRLRGEEQ